MIYVYWTCRDKSEAKMIIHALLEKQLIACASIFPEVESIYRWENKTQESREIKVLLKTVQSHFDEIQSTILKHGSYEVPEIVQITIDQSSPAYLSWVLQETNLKKAVKK